MFFDDFNGRKRKGITPPDNSEFLQMLLTLVGENIAVNNYSVTTDDLTRQLQIILQDEFTGDVHIKPNNTLALCLSNGEQFNIRIEKSGHPDFFY